MSLSHFSGKTLVICPHFDDACFSVGGLLLKKTSEEVTILTVFSKSQYAPNLKPLKPFLKANPILNLNLLRSIIAEWVSKERQKEDWRFCDSLGVVQSMLPFSDFSLRKYRTAHSRTLQSNATCLVDNVERDPLYDDVCEAIAKYVFSGSYDSILCPLAIGDHVDHIMVLKAFLQVIKENKDIPVGLFLYEDLPYASHYKLDFISSLALQRTGRNSPLFIDITTEMPLKLQKLDIYRSQFEPSVKEKITFHAKRLSTLGPKKVDTAVRYSERLWRINVFFNYRIVVEESVRSTRFTGGAKE